jgi:Flp pilus assembly protein TadD
LAGAAFAASSDTQSDTASGAPGVKAALLSQSVDTGIRDAQAKRAAGDLTGAVRVLSQLIMINADDPRVVAEYGKVLVQQGRTREALDFLNRAAQLAQNDWTVYSALGVAYDASGDYASAKAAYDHALQIKPGEVAILNNYALSRAMAGDLVKAKGLIAQAAATSKDERISRNATMINALTPQAAAKTAAALPPPSTAAKPTRNEGVHKTSRSTAAVAPSEVSGTGATAASGPPRTLTTAEGKQIVMQAVPYDPKAGSVVKTRKAAAKAAAKQSNGIPALRLANDSQ